MSDLSIQDLQIKLAFLERHVEEQDRVMHALQRELSAMRQKLARTEERLESSDSNQTSPPADERPPHY